MHRLRAWLRVAADPAILRRALVTAVIVGVLLSAINHGDELLRDQVDGAMVLEMVLTFLVPFLVSLTSSVATVQRQRAGHGQELVLLEREIETINKFPDQNPNPVMRAALDGRLLYANPASEPILEAWGIHGREMLPAPLLADLSAANELTGAADPPPARALEVKAGWRTYAVLPVAVPEFGFLNLYGTDVTGAKVVERFPDKNPNPVMRMSPEGTLIYANAASAPLVAALGVKVGAPLPGDLVERLRGACEGPAESGSIEVRGEGHTFALRPVPIPEFDFTNIYGTDVTALKALDKFPDQNPNPVLRVSREGKLLYANPASALVRRALGVEVGDELAAEFLGPIQARLATQSPEVLEVQGEGRIFELLVVSVFEFGFINLYGTDVTAAREVEKAHAESERLLLNILPVSIADRLRKGETIIADRFEEMTVLFADVVGFTPLSSRLAPAQVVTLLNSIFSACDRLADKYRLEKIKTIGDAYMVVGGLTTGGGDVESVADMGLEMIAEVARLARETGQDLRIRVGMHTGPAVAGVIGIKKFIYDVWGDTVNTASRMESHGEPGRLQVTESSYERLRDGFTFEARGVIEVRGKGPMRTYFLTGRKAAQA